MSVFLIIITYLGVNIFFSRKIPFSYGFPMPSEILFSYVGKIY